MSLGNWPRWIRFQTKLSKRHRWAELNEPFTMTVELGRGSGGVRIPVPGKENESPPSHQYYILE